MSTRRGFFAQGLALVGGASLGSVPARVQAQSERRPSLALVLGGGSARGFAHIGVIKALESQGIRPDAIYGASAGALVGAFWASGVSAAAMESLAYRVRDDEVIDLVSGQAGNRRGIVSGHALQAFVNQQLGQRPIESFPTSFRAVATRYPEGTLHIFKQGDAGFAVRASCSLPGVFLPAARGDEEYLDGGLISPIPVQAARAEGHDLVVAVDVGGADPGNRHDRGAGLFQVLLRSFEIMGEALRRQEGARADILVRPDVARVSSTDFAARRVLVEAGFQAGQRLAPVIRQKLERLR